MSTHNIPFSVKKKTILGLQLFDFSQGMKSKFEAAVVNEPLVFKPLRSTVMTFP